MKTYKPTSDGQRSRISADFDEITRSKPEKSLLAPMKQKAGRNNTGRITVRHRGGGHKKRYRIVDFKRSIEGTEGIVFSIEYDPNRSARIALVKSNSSLFKIKNIIFKNINIDNNSKKIKLDIPKIL